MRKVVLDAVIFDTDPGTVFENVAQFNRYPDLAPHVRSTVVTQSRPDLAGASDWELYFRSGMLRWSEAERFLKDELRIEFEQTDGDFEVFRGFWTLQSEAGGTRLHFECDFDFGIESLQGILDPIASRVIKESIACAVVGLHERVQLEGGLDLSQTVAGGADLHSA